MFLLVCFSGSFPFSCLLLNFNLVLLLPLVLLLVLLVLLVLVPYTCGLAFLTDELRAQLPRATETVKHAAHMLGIGCSDDTFTW